MKVALVRNKFSPIVVTKDPAWEKFCRSFSEVTVGDKDGLGWLPADIDTGVRKSEHVRSISALVLDVEVNRHKVEPPSVDVMRDRLRKTGYACHIHTSYNHSPDHPRYRIIVRPDRSLKPSELKRAVVALAESLGLTNFYDAACTDAARLFYTPRCPLGREHLFIAESIDGRPAVVDKLIGDNRHNNIKCPLAATILPFPKTEMPETPQAVSAVRDALKYVSADCDYPLWRNVIWAVMSTGWSTAKDMAREWSSTAPTRFDEARFVVTVESFDHSQDITIGTLFHHAKEGGWPGDSPNQLPPQVETIRRFSFTKASAYAALPTLPSRIKGLLPESGLASVFGPSGSGKSFLILDMLAALAAGSNWFGFKVRPCPVIYVPLEGSEGVKRRLKAWQKYHGAALPDNFVISEDKVSLFNQDASAFSQAIIDDGLEGGVIVIDTLNRSAPEADENSSADMGRIIQNAMSLQKETKALVILVHHTGKERSRGLRGHSSLLAALDVAIEVSNTEHGREWKISKSKDGEDGVSHPFCLDAVNLGDDEDGDPITSCIVINDLFRKAILKEPTGKNQLSALNAIRANLKKGGTIACDKALSLVVEVVTGDEPRRKNARAKKAISDLLNSGHLTKNGDIYEAI